MGGGKDIPVDAFITSAVLGFLMEVPAFFEDALRLLFCERLVADALEELDVLVFIHYLHGVAFLDELSLVRGLLFSC